MISAREFVLLTHFNMTPAGVIYVVGFNSNRDDLAPETKGIVRGSVPYGGWRLEPLDGGTKCRMSFMAEINLGGNIPGFVMKPV